MTDHEALGSSRFLGERIRQRRSEAGLSLSALALKADVSKGYLWNLESGEGQKRPSGRTLYRIAAALGTTMSDLLGQRLLTEEPEQIPPALLEFAREASLSETDIRMLAGVNFRGQQPHDKAAWEFIWRAIRASVNE